MRKLHGYTQTDIANMCEVTQATIHLIEVGERRPSIELGKKLAKLFDLSLEEMWNMFYE